MGTEANYPDRYAEALGLALTEQEIEAVLDLARVVAHGSERRFAPLSTYIAGQFVAELVGTGLPRAEALAEAAAVAERVLAMVRPATAQGGEVPGTAAQSGEG